MKLMSDFFTENLWKSTHEIFEISQVKLMSFQVPKGLIKTEMLFFAPEIGKLKSSCHWQTRSITEQASMFEHTTVVVANV